MNIHDTRHYKLEIINIIRVVRNNKSSALILKCKAK